jgi:hypothetical protein
MITIKTENSKLNFGIKQAIIRLSGAAKIKKLGKKPDLRFVKTYHTGIRSKKVENKIHLVRNIKDTPCKNLR